MKGFTNNFGEYFLPITIIFLICYIFYKIYKWLKPTPFPYVKKTLLSKNELSFYKNSSLFLKNMACTFYVRLEWQILLKLKRG